MSFGSINQKILAAGVAVLLLGLVSAGAGIWVAFSLSSALTETTRTAAAIRQHMQADMMHDALRSDALSAILASDPSSGVSMAETKADLADHASSFRQALATNKGLITDPEVKATVTALDEPLAKYISSAEMIVRLGETDPAAALSHLNEFKQQFSVLEGGMEKAGDTIEAYAKKTSDKANAFAAMGRILMFVVLALGVVFAGVLVIVARRSLVQPIGDVTNALRRLAKGDLSVVPPHVSRADEIGVMSRALDSFKEAMAGRQSEAEAAVQRQLLEEERARNEIIRAKAEEEQAFAVNALSRALDRLSAGDLTARLTETFPESYRKIQDDYNQAVARLCEAMAGILGQNAAAFGEKAAVVWGRVRYLVRKRDFIPIKEEFFSERGELVRVLSFFDVRSVGGRTLPTRWEMRPVAKPGNITTVVLKDAVFDRPVDEAIFTQRNLQKP